MGGPEENEMGKITKIAAPTMADVDKLGELRAAMAVLKAEADALELKLKKAGGGVYAGQLFDANVIVANRETVDWKAVAAKLNPNRQLVTAHTKHAVVVTLKVTAKPKGEQAIAA